MKREHPPFRQMGNFKAVAMDYEYYATLEDCERLYKLTDKQVYILLVQLEYVGWLTRWYNTDDINQNVTELIKSDLMEALMECVDISVLIDQGKLRLSRDVQQQQLESQRLREDYEAEYTGDPTSINPDAPTVNFGASGDRLDALCAGLMAMVYQFANYQIQAIVAGDAAAFALLAGAAILLIPGLNLFFIAGAAIALIAGGGIIGVTTATAVAALSDTEALNNVVCYMREQLKALSVTQANFTSVLDSYPWGVGTNEAIISDFLKPTLSDNYLPMLDMLGQAYSGLINGEPVPQCPCELGEWRIFTELAPTYNGGVIIAQNASSVTVLSGANADNVYRVFLINTIGCRTITGVTITPVNAWGNRGCEEFNVIVDPESHVSVGEFIDRLELHSMAAGQARYTLTMSWE